VVDLLVDIQLNITARIFIAYYRLIGFASALLKEAEEIASPVGITAGSFGHQTVHYSVFAQTYYQC